MPRSNNGGLGRQIAAALGPITYDKVKRVAEDNTHIQQKYWRYGTSIAELLDHPMRAGDSALVIASGPSLHRFRFAQIIKKSNFKGTIISADSALSWCLRNGIAPDLVVTLDPHRERVVRWFGDKHLTLKKLRADDYFSRQDMDPVFQKSQLRLNQATLQLMNKHGHKINIAICTSASEAVVERAREAHMKIYWWNPLYESFEKKGGLSQKVYRMNGYPLINAGGNVGTAAWVIAHAILGKSRIGLLGMDLGYYGDTPYYRTQYYYEIKDLVGEQGLDSVYVRFWNPYVKKEFYTDPAYLWYRNVFLEMAQKAPCETVNCTGGGILFGDPIKVMPLERFLRNSNGSPRN